MKLILSLFLNATFMAKKDLFEKPFDDGTISKLEIFEDYFKEWLPVFISRKEIIWNNIQIFDFFAGEGKDVSGGQWKPFENFKGFEPK